MRLPQGSFQTQFVQVSQEPQGNRLVVIWLVCVAVVRLEKQLVQSHAAPAEALELGSII